MDRGDSVYRVDCIGRVSNHETCMVGDDHVYQDGLARGIGYRVGYPDSLGCVAPGFDSCLAAESLEVVWSYR